jgi:hypothetical protein
VKDGQLREIRLHESGFGVDILIIGEVCFIIEFLVADASKVSKHRLAENYDMGMSMIYL